MQIWCVEAFCSNISLQLHSPSRNMIVPSSSLQDCKTFLSTLRKSEDGRTQVSKLRKYDFFLCSLALFFYFHELVEYKESNVGIGGFRQLPWSFIISDCYTNKHQLLLFTCEMQSSHSVEKCLSSISDFGA